MKPMPHQMRPSVTNPTIANLYQSIQAKRLILRPDFQRKFVWTHEHQEKFLDTILNGFPFPEIYVCAGEVDVQNLTTTQHVIDGQQRLTTIKRYIDGEHDRRLVNVPRYAELADERKQRFLTYQVVVRDIGEVDDDTVREIFRRINLTKFKLEDIEIHNAVYDGEFIQAAKQILAENPLEQYGVFRESEFTRMADLHFVLLVMATIENEGYFAQDREVEPKVAEYNEEYPNRESMVARLRKTFALIDSLRLPEDSIWFRKSNFFTLVTELAIHENTPNNLKDRLLKLEETIITHKNDSTSPYSKYYSYMYQATHGRAARVTRSGFFRRDVLELDTKI
jgi:hypothetical protein